ncbi:MAG: hypothetical protein KAX18_01730 [Candidatus Lokiarchaeota archaeon]|nr:hypothetical protein [Candidatus Lokiarchaeota archaeon]
MSTKGIKNMKFNGPIFEQRMTTIRQTSQMDADSLREYVSYCKNNYFIELEKAGAKVICLFQGIIGIPTNVFLQLTLYPDINTYYKVHAQTIRKNEHLIKEEQIKFLKTITSYPKDPFPVEDIRPIYSNRAFFIQKKDIELYADLSFKHVWPLYEAWGCGILGLFSSLTFEHLHEIKLFAGYKSIAHWEQTRALTGVRPDSIDNTIWEEGRNAVFQRAELTLASNVSLMRKVYLSNVK